MIGSLRVTNVKRLSVLGLLLPVLLVGCGKGAPKEAHKLDEKAVGGFSYDPPAGFEIAEFPGVKYHISRGAPMNGFSPNVVVVDETYAGNLTDYVDLNMVTLKKGIPSVNELKRDSVTSNDGPTATRVVVEDVQGDSKLRQTFYFFENGSRKYVVTCTAPADGGDKLDSTFEAGVKTFRMH